MLTYCNPLWIYEENVKQTTNSRNSDSQVSSISWAARSRTLMATSKPPTRLWRRLRGQDPTVPMVNIRKHGQKSRLRWSVHLPKRLGDSLHLAFGGWSRDQKREGNHPICSHTFRMPVADSSRLATSAVGVREATSSSISTADLNQMQMVNMPRKLILGMSCSCALNWKNWKKLTNKLTMTPMF